MQIDLDAHVTENFKWREVLYCPQWSAHVFPVSDLHRQNIISTCEILEQIRDILNSPLKITSLYRPKAYNKQICGAVNSLHLEGKAADFIPTAVPIQNAKIALKSFLEQLNCRMEDNGKGGWIHIDTGEPGFTGRFFKP